MATRINPAELNQNLLSPGDYIGPYSFRAGRGNSGVRISARSAGVVDTATILILEPGVIPTANENESVRSEAGTAVGALTVPFSITLGPDELGGACDVYLQATALANPPMKAKIQKAYL